MPHTLLARRPVAAAALLALLPAAAVADATAPPVQTIVITANPLAREQPVAPVAAVDGDALAERRGATLGDTLDTLPGVAGSRYGANASRPVIRGLDGDRVKLLDNGGGVVDASALSFDHAVAIDPLLVERVEVLRGPAALLYGGSAVGGVVQVIDGRIARSARDGFGGRVEGRLGGAASERAGAVVLEGGAGGFAWQVDAAGRRADDPRVPRFVPVEAGPDGDEPLPSATRVRNAAGETRAAGLGAGWAGAAGHAGVALDRFETDYGITAEPDVTIRLWRERARADGEWRLATGPLASIAAQASATRYRHDEIEGSGEVGTRFAYRGEEGRVELRHRGAGASHRGGVVGVQLERLDAVAEGEEAFVPATDTRADALFVLQELRAGAWDIALGARTERVRVASRGDAPGGDEPRFGEAVAREFSPRSVSLAWRGAPGGGWQLDGTLARTQRAPSYAELYANGLHLATAAFEVGDPGLATETSRHLELGLAFRGSGATRLRAAVFRTSFANYIALRASGRFVEVEDHHGDEGHGEEDHGHEGGEDHGEGEEGEERLRVAEYRFEAVRAVLTGGELEAETRLSAFGRPLALRLGLDTVRGTDRDRREPLPRLPPWRLSAGATLAIGGVELGATLQHAARQSRVPATDVATPGSTRLDLSLAGRVGDGGRWRVLLANVTDELAFDATAVRTVRGLSPRPGRSLSASLRWRW